MFLKKFNDEIDEINSTEIYFNLKKILSIFVSSKNVIN